MSGYGTLSINGIPIEGAMVEFTPTPAMAQAPIPSLRYPGLFAIPGMEHRSANALDVKTALRRLPRALGTAMLAADTRSVRVLGGPPRGGMSWQSMHALKSGVRV